MKKRFSLITASFVARELGYRMDGGWSQGENATQAWFAPLETYRERLDALLLEVKALGFSRIDLWAAHLHWHWATLGHVDIAKELLKKHDLEVTSYASWVPGDAGELHRACRLCKELGVPVIGGFIELFGKDRSAAVAVLREHGITYAFENHSQRSIGEILEVIGTGDEDIVGIALDTGWLVTQGVDTFLAVKELLPRIKIVHLKDVLPCRERPTGLQFVDMGHETCGLGDGLVPMQQILDYLKQHDFRGALCIEHEPEMHDPTDEIRSSHARAQAWYSIVSAKEAAPPMKLVVVGCGNIANAYGEALRLHPELRVLGASDIDLSRAQSWVEKNGGKAYESLDAVLADPEVETVVNLTIHQAHAEVITRCLNAGKHVHSEKPLATEPASAAALVRLAEKKGLRLSCAPASWLGEAQQSAWKLIREGRLGRPRVAYATVEWGRIESWHPNPEPFFAVGPVMDVGVYPLTLLTAWFGPVWRVIAGGGVVLPSRIKKDGGTFTPGTDDWAVAVLDTESGVKLRLSVNFYVGAPFEKPAALEVHGDAGSLETSWFAATAPIHFGECGGTYRTIKPLQPATGSGPWFCDWAAGPLELWRGLRTQQPHPTTGAHAAHVVEVIDAIHRSIAQGRSVEVKSRFPAPLPLAWAR